MNDGSMQDPDILVLTTGYCPPRLAPRLRDNLMLGERCIRASHIAGLYDLRPPELWRVACALRRSSCPKPCPFRSRA